MYSEGFNQPCALEKTLMAADEHLGRSDLADFIRRGKKFQRLLDILTFQVYKVEHLNATRRAFLDLPDDGQIEPSTQDEWIRLAMKKYKDDEGYRR
ncbi:hypothetical protein BCR39DRAFT_538204 [Naematelia encephala]|uniref:Uncharacterized protein n=1 Tax=Naematelia encephala TaxID=71784 RepID=A0A1Y2AYV6_9TREE|nr:hypothetical protein BCR39DRAFT_538204 [Naematelia encephala]